MKTFIIIILTLWAVLLRALVLIFKVGIIALAVFLVLSICGCTASRHPSVTVAEESAVMAGSGSDSVSRASSERSVFGRSLEISNLSVLFYPPSGESAARVEKRDSTPPPIRAQPSKITVGSIKASGCASASSAARTDSVAGRSAEIKSGAVIRAPDTRDNSSLKPIMRLMLCASLIMGVFAGIMFLKTRK